MTGGEDMTPDFVNLTEEAPVGRVVRRKTARAMVEPSGMTPEDVVYTASRNCSGVSRTSLPDQCNTHGVRTHG